MKQQQHSGRLRCKTMPVSGALPGGARIPCVVLFPTTEESQPLPQTQSESDEAAPEGGHLSSQSLLGMAAKQLLLLLPPPVLGVCWWQSRPGCALCSKACGERAWKVLRAQQRVCCVSSVVLMSKKSWKILFLKDYSLVSVPTLKWFAKCFMSISILNKAC